MLLALNRSQGASLKLGKRAGIAEPGAGRWLYLELEFIIDSFKI